MVNTTRPSQSERSNHPLSERNGDLLSLYLFYTMSYAQRQNANTIKITGSSSVSSCSTEGALSISAVWSCPQSPIS